MLHYERAVESKRRSGQRRIEVFSPKIKRRVTLFSWDSHDARLLLEADPTVSAFCERPAYVDGPSGRVLDFWVEQGGQSRFWVLSPEGSEDGAALPKSVKWWISYTCSSASGACGITPALPQRVRRQS